MSNSLERSLYELIDAYGAARSTGNEKLMQMAAATLQSFMSQVTISVKEKPVEKAEGEAPEPEAPQEEAPEPASEEAA